MTEQKPHFGQVNTYLSKELFAPSIVIVQRSLGSTTLSKLLIKSHAEYLVKNYKPRELMEMMEAYEEIKNKPKTWW